MIDIIDFVEDLTRESTAFAHHPMCSFELEDKILYLNGISLLITVDGNIHKKEQDYLTILIKSFGLALDQVDEILSFAQNPDKDTMQTFFRRFRDQEISWTVLLDCIMMAHHDGHFHEKEQIIIDSISENLNIEVSKKAEIEELFIRLNNKDWTKSSTFFLENTIHQKYLKYILTYFNTTLDELLHRSEFPMPKKITWENIKYSNNEDLDVNETKITQEAISNYWLLKFLNDHLRKGKLYISKTFVLSNKGELLLDLKKSKISYLKEAEEFTCKYDLLLKEMNSYTPSLAKSLARFYSAKLIQGYTSWDDEECYVHYPENLHSFLEFKNNFFSFPSSSFFFNIEITKGIQSTELIDTPLYLTR